MNLCKKHFFLKVAESESGHWDKPQPPKTPLEMMFFRRCRMETYELAGVDLLPEG